MEPTGMERPSTVSVCAGSAVAAAGRYCFRTPRLVLLRPGIAERVANPAAVGAEIPAGVADWPTGL